MDENTLNFLKHKVANALMRAHGWDRRDSTHKNEFDPANPDSQFSMMYEDADTAVRTFLDALMDLEVDSDIPEMPEVATTPADTTVDTGEPVTPLSDNVNVQDTRYIYVENTPPGNPMYVSDIREWLKVVEDSGISDDTEVEGQLYVSQDKHIHNHPTLF